MSFLKESKMINSYFYLNVPFLNGTYYIPTSPLKLWSPAARLSQALDSTIQKAPTEWLANSLPTLPLPPNNDTLVTRIPDSCKVLHVSMYLVLLGASLLAGGDSRDPK